MWQFNEKIMVSTALLHNRLVRAKRALVHYFRLSDLIWLSFVAVWSYSCIYRGYFSMLGCGRRFLVDFTLARTKVVSGLFDYLFDCIHLLTVKSVPDRHPENLAFQVAGIWNCCLDSSCIQRHLKVLSPPFTWKISLSFEDLILEVYLLIFFTK